MERLKTNIVVNKPIDFEEKWDKWLKEVHSVKNNVEIIEVQEEPFGKRIKFYFDSVCNTKIYAILYLPFNPKGIVAYYHGHNSYIDEDHNIWHCMNLVNINLAVMAMDMRFQNGKVNDQNEYRYKEYPAACFNVDDLENCYNKRLNQDALKMIDIIKDDKCFKELKSLPLIAAGPSQGGGLSLMVGAFCDVDLIVSDVPSDCALVERIKHRQGKYTALDDFIKDHKELKDLILYNQGYFDVVNMAERIKCPVYSSVGMIDEICPAKLYYLAYEKMTCEKHLDLYEGYGHGGFEEIHIPKKFKFIKDKIGY